MDLNLGLVRIQKEILTIILFQLDRELGLDSPDAKIKKIKEN